MASAQITEIIEQMKAKFINMDIDKKKRFIDNLKQKTAGSSNSQFKKFLDNCMLDYDNELKLKTPAIDAGVLPYDFESENTEKDINGNINTSDDVGINTDEVSDTDTDDGTNNDETINLDSLSQEERYKHLKLQWILENRKIDKEIGEVYDFCVSKCGIEESLEELLDIEGGVVVKRPYSFIYIEDNLITGNFWGIFRDKRNILKLQWIIESRKLDEEIGEVYDFYRSKCGTEEALDNLLDIIDDTVVQKNDGATYIDDIFIEGDLWKVFKDKDSLQKLEWIAENREIDVEIEEVYDYYVGGCGTEEALLNLLDIENEFVVKKNYSEALVLGSFVKGDFWKIFRNKEIILKLGWLETNRQIHNEIGEVYDFYSSNYGTEKALRNLLDIEADTVVKKVYSLDYISDNFIKGDFWEIFKDRDNILKLEWIEINRKIDEAVGKVYNFCARNWGTIETLRALLDVESGKIVKKNYSEIFVSGNLIKGNFWEEFKGKNDFLKLEWILRNGIINEEIEKIYDYYENKYGTDEAFKDLSNMLADIQQRDYDVNYTNNLWEKFKGSEKLLKLEWIEKSRLTNKEIGEVYDFYESKCGIDKALEDLLRIENGEVVKQYYSEAFTFGTLIKGDFWDIFRDKENILKLEWTEKNRKIDKEIGEVYDFYSNKLSTNVALKDLLEIKNNIVIKKTYSLVVLSDIFIEGDLWEIFRDKNTILKLEWIIKNWRLDKELIDTYDFYRKKCGTYESLKNLLDVMGESVIKKYYSETYVLGVLIKGDFWEAFQDKENFLKLVWITRNVITDESLKAIYDYIANKWGVEAVVSNLLYMGEDFTVSKRYYAEAILSGNFIKGDFWTVFNSRENILKLEWLEANRIADEEIGEIYDFCASKFGTDIALVKLLQMEAYLIAKKYYSEASTHDILVKGNFWNIFRDKENILKLEWIIENKESDEGIERIYDFYRRKYSTIEALQNLLDAEGESVVKKYYSEAYIDSNLIRGNFWDVKEFLKLEWIARNRQIDRKIGEIFDFCVIKCGTEVALQHLLDMEGEVVVQKTYSEAYIDDEYITGNFWELFRDKDTLPKLIWIIQNRAADEEVAAAYDFCVTKCGTDIALKNLLDIDGEFIVKRNYSKAYIDDIFIEGSFWDIFKEEENLIKLEWIIENKKTDNEVEEVYDFYRRNCGTYEALKNLLDIQGQHVVKKHHSGASIDGEYITGDFWEIFGRGAKRLKD